MTNQPSAYLPNVPTPDWSRYWTCAQNHVFVGSETEKFLARKIKHLQSVVREGLWAARGFVARMAMNQKVCSKLVNPTPLLVTRMVRDSKFSRPMRDTLKTEGVVFAHRCVAALEKMVRTIQPPAQRINTMDNCPLC